MYSDGTLFPESEKAGTAIQRVTLSFKPEAPRKNRWEFYKLFMLPSVNSAVALKEYTKSHIRRFVIDHNLIYSNRKFAVLDSMHFITKFLLKTAK